MLYSEFRQFLFLTPFENFGLNEIPAFAGMTAFAGVLAFGKRQNRKSEKFKLAQYKIGISEKKNSQIHLNTCLTVFYSIKKIIFPVYGCILKKII